MDATKKETQTGVTREGVWMPQKNMEHLETREVIEDGTVLHRATEELSVS